MEANNVVKLANYKSAKTKSFDDECAEAYAWILQVQKTQGWYSEQLRITFGDGDFIEESDCVVSLFVDKKSGKAILCREWPDDMLVKFNQIVNPNEIRMKAPKSYKQMVETGLEVYHQRGRGYKAMYLTEKNREQER